MQVAITMPTPVEVHQEDAFRFIVELLRKVPRSECSNYGYDLYLPTVMRRFLKLSEGLEEHSCEIRMRVFGDN